MDKNSKDLKSRLIKANHSVALITPVGMGIHGEVVSGFIQENERLKQPFRVYPYYTRGVNTIDVTHCVEEVLQENFNLIVTVGLVASKVAHEILIKKNKTIPLLSVGITDKIASSVLQPFMDKYGYSSALFYTRSLPEKALQFLYECKPNMHRLLLPAEITKEEAMIDSTTFWLIQEAKQIEEFCISKNISFDFHHYSLIGGLFDFVKDKINDYDAIFLLEGTMAIEIHADTGELCNAAGVTLFSGTLEAVKTSSALGYGTSFFDLGIKAIDCAKQILLEGIAPNNLPFYMAEDTRRPAINTSLATHQGLDVNHIKRVCNKWNGIIFTKKD